MQQFGRKRRKQKEKDKDRRQKSGGLKDERAPRERGTKRGDGRLDETKRARMSERERARERRRVERYDEEEPNERVTT